MLLEPVRQNRAKAQVSRVKDVPPPTEGWNARDDITDMGPREAIVLDNIIPGDGGVTLRKGRTAWATGIGIPVEALMEFSSPDAPSELFAAADENIYDVTASGAVGAAVHTGLANGWFQHIMFATTGGSFLVAVNGADGVLTYDGTDWATQTITGATAANFISVMQHQSRIWFIEENTLKVWYLDALAIAGGATSINFDSLSRLGGKLMAMASWTRDSGQGIEDLAVFITSKGEVHIYSGSDPASAETWARVGTFKIPEPLGRRCIIKVAGDVGILTTQGLVPLSGVLNKAESAQSRTAITDKIRKAFTSAYDRSPDSRSWSMIEHPVSKLLLINVPIIDQDSAEQYVMNSNTGKWCRFTNIHINCFSLAGVDLYMGGLDGTVYRYGGDSDDGEDIEGIAVSAFTDFGTVNDKFFRRVKPQFYGPLGYRPAVGLVYDYDEQIPQLTPASGQSSGTEWDVGEWDVMAWSAAGRINSRWQGVKGRGFTVAAVVAIRAQEPITYNGCKVLYETGTAL